MSYWDCIRCGRGIEEHGDGCPPAASWVRISPAFETTREAYEWEADREGNC